MAVNAQDFLFSARASLANENEIGWRNAVSRAYYGAFHQAQASALKLGWSEYAAGGTHERLSSLWSDKGYKSHAYRLRQLHRERCTSDYNIHAAVSFEVAADRVKEAERLVADLSALEK